MRYNECMEDSIFTKIINGEIPCHKVYEDDLVFAFLDIHPINTGHTLVVPKRQVEALWDLDDESFQGVMAAVKKIALHMRKTLDVGFVGEQVIGVDVPHAHVHLIPFNDVSEYHNVPDSTIEPNHGALAATARKIQL